MVTAIRRAVQTNCPALPVANYTVQPEPARREHRRVSLLQWVREETDNFRVHPPSRLPMNWEDLSWAKMGCISIDFMANWARQNGQLPQVLVIVPGMAEMLQMERQLRQSKKSKAFRWLRWSIGVCLSMREGSGFSLHTISATAVIITSLPR